MERAGLPEVIETVRLVLRPWTLADAEDVYAYAKDPEWSRFLRILPRPYERRHADEFVARQILLDRLTHPSWAITLEGTPIGGINLRLQHEHRVGEIGYSVARAHWGKGHGTEATAAVIDASFGELSELNRLKARADAANAASHRVMEKCGMTREGVLRQDRVERGEAFDEVWYGILRAEWEGRAA